MVLLSGVMEVLPRRQRGLLELMAWEGEVRRIGDLGINKAAQMMD